MCAHELNLSSLYVSDDSTAKISTKKHLVIHIERNIEQKPPPAPAAARAILREAKKINEKIAKPPNFFI